MGPIRDNPVTDPLALLHLDNQLCTLTFRFELFGKSFIFLATINYYLKAQFPANLCLQNYMAEAAVLPRLLVLGYV